MSDYIVSARKYRPDTFESLIGQDNIAQTLKNSIQRGQLAHAYLFCGPRGVGKTSTARIFAKTINCSNPGQNLEPCGECESCLSFQEGRSYCIHELDAASNNSVEDMRKLLEQVQIPPQIGRYSVFIIDEVHMLSTQAFNAFLKTLEEPPAHAIFILCTTEKHKILPTILSRCQTYDFNRIAIPDMVANLRGIAGKEGITISDESLHLIAQKADGAMRDALTLFDQTVAFCGNEVQYADVVRNLGVLDYEYSFRLVDAFLAGDYATALLIFDEVLGKGFNALHFVSALSSHFRDLLVARTGGLESLLDLPDSFKEKYSAQAAGCSVKFLYDSLGITSECEAGYKYSSNQRLHIEYALMRLAFLLKAPAAAPGTASAPAAPAVRSSTSESTAPAVRSESSASEPSAKAAPAVRSEPSASEPSAKTAPAVRSEPSASEPSAKAAPAKADTAATTEESSAKQPEAAPAAEQPPAGEAAPLPKASPKSGKKAASRLAALLDDEADGGEGEDETEVSSAPDVLPDNEKIMAAWPALVKDFSAGRPRLANTLRESKLSVEEGEGFKTIDFEVLNESQKKWMEERILRDLERALNEKLDTKGLRLSVSVRPPEQTEQKIYMPEEKAQDLMDKNPEVREFIKDLGLDTK